MKDKLAELIKELDCIKYGNFILASGRKSNYKIELDDLFKDERGKKLVGELGVELLKNIGDYEIAGVHRGGSLFAELVAKELGKDYVSVDYKSKKIFGDLRTKEYVVFEDVTTTGGSVLKVAKMIRRYTNVRNAITVVDRQEGAEKNLEKSNIKLRWILTKSDLRIN